MKISGFSFARNADTLGYPVAESIRSALPVCDEFVVAVGAGDDGDRTRDVIEGIGSPKIRIIDTEWTDRETLRSRIYSQQTNIALSACTGDWCFYIQADEVLHERYLPVIRARCETLLDNRRVEGLLFSFRHFWGDYFHYQDGHEWYPREIRIVRNGIGVRSINDAQSFRIGERKLRVANAGAEMFHYGWVRHPKVMQTRNRAARTTYEGADAAAQRYAGTQNLYDYGSLNALPVFTNAHPAVMGPRVGAMDWGHLLTYDGPMRRPAQSFKHRLLTALEKRLFGGRRIGGYKNYVLLKKA
jgi:hypothetical protein